MTGEKLIELADYRRSRLAGANARREDRYHEAVSFLDTLRSTTRIPKSDRSAIASNLGRLLIQLEPENYKTAAKKLLDETYWAKRKRYIRFPDDGRRSTVYAASGATFAGLIQRIIDEHILGGADSSQITIEIISRALRGTSYKPSRFSRTERVEPAGNSKDASFLVQKIQRVMATLADVVDLFDYFDLVSKHPVYPLGLRIRDGVRDNRLVILDPRIGPNDVANWHHWIADDEYQNWIPWWAPKCVIGHLYIPVATKCLRLPEDVIATIKEICGGEIDEDTWRRDKDECLGEIEPFRTSDFVTARTVFHRLPIWLAVLSWAGKLVPALYLAVDDRVDEFQIEQSVHDDSYFSYTESTSPRFVHTLGTSIDSDAVFFPGDEDDEEPLYICPSGQDVYVIGSGIDDGAGLFKEKAFEPMLDHEVPHWLHDYPVHQLLTLTTDSDSAIVFSLTPRRFVNVDTRWWSSEGIEFRPAFADSFAHITRLQQNTLGAYLLRNFTHEANSIFEALKSDAIAKDTAVRNLLDGELSHFERTFLDRYGK